MFKMLLIQLCLLLSGFDASAAQGDDGTNTLSEIEQHINRAETWYWWARASENSVEMHKRSQKSYEDALTLANQTPGKQSQRLAEQAKEGLAQMPSRIVRSFEV